MMQCNDPYTRYNITALPRASAFTSSLCWEIPPLDESLTDRMLLLCNYFHSILIFIWGVYLNLAILQTTTIASTVTIKGKPKRQKSWRHHLIFLIISKNITLHSIICWGYPPVPLSPDSRCSHFNIGIIDFGRCITACGGVHINEEDDECIKEEREAVVVVMRWWY